MQHQNQQQIMSDGMLVATQEAMLSPLHLSDLLLHIQDLIIVLCQAIINHLRTHQVLTTLHHIHRVIINQATLRAIHHLVTVQAIPVIITNLPINKTLTHRAIHQDPVEVVSMEITIMEIIIIIMVETTTEIHLEVVACQEIPTFQTITMEVNKEGALVVQDF